MTGTTGELRYAAARTPTSRNFGTHGAADI
jgi:hypothetical protein